MNTITYIEELAVGVFALSFTAGGLKPPVPGTFVHICCSEGTDRMLRRPVSVADYFPGDGAENEAEITVVFEVRGEGTYWLSQRKEGDTLSVMGALGNGFIYPESGQVLLVGGGLGIAPLLYAASYSPTPLACDAILGFRSQKNIILTGDYSRLCRNVTIATDDGSYGQRGTVIRPMENALEETVYSAIFACGPHPMLEAVTKTAKKRGIPAYVSLEERMACGIGACLGCAVRVHRDDGTEKMAHVCHDGPVFNTSEVIW